jgi:hypothetical protein
MDEGALRAAFACLPRVVAAYVRDPRVGDPEYADVTLYVEVTPPYHDSVGSEVRAAITPIVGDDGVGGTHVQSAAHPTAGPSAAGAAQAARKTSDRSARRGKRRSMLRLLSPGSRSVQSSVASSEEGCQGAALHCGPTHGTALAPTMSPVPISDPSTAAVCDVASYRATSRFANMKTWSSYVITAHESSVDGGKPV